MNNDNITLNLTKDEVRYLYDALENTHAIDPNADIMKSTFQTVQGKLFSQAPFLINTYKEIRDNRYCKENQFDNGRLFMGTGWISFNKRNMMHKRLAYAAMVLGGKEQNGGMGTAFDEESDQHDEHEIKTALRDIAAAFGYKPEDLINETLRSEEIETGTGTG